jgi:Tfp pilus assembly protein PilV
MKTEYVKQNGFSLAEALIATAILALGLVMIAMAFPVGVRLASISTERPVGVIAGNEAMAKMRLYGIKPFTNPSDPNWPANTDGDAATNVYNTCTDYWQVYAAANTTGAMTVFEINDQRCYPSLVPQPVERRYYWSALVRGINANTKEVQATVFVCRILGMSATYYDMDHTLASPLANNDNLWPVPVRVRVQASAISPTSPKEIEVVIPSPLDFAPAGAEYRFFTEGCFIVENSTGTIYRVTELKDKDNDATGVRETLVLDKNFPTTAGTLYDVWVVPPAVGSSRNPCIDVVQTTMTIP